LGADNGFAIRHQFHIARKDDGNGVIYATVDRVRECFFGFGSQFGNGFPEDFAGEGFKIVIFTTAV